MNNRSILEFLQTLGMQPQNPEFRQDIDLWESWYRGKVERFHTYTVFNGVKTVKRERASLNMAKTVAEDWANLLLNEKVVIAVEGRQEQLDEVLEDNRFGVDANRCVEWAFATGTAAFSEYLDADGNVRIDYHKGSQVWPLKWEGTRITECAFSSVASYGDGQAVFLRVYRAVRDGYQRIENYWLDYESGKRLATPEGVVESVMAPTEVPLFQIITPNIANNVDTTCPMGISVFANAIDCLQAVDAVFDSYQTEFLLGRKRLMVPMSMVQIERSREGGDMVPVFDVNDLAYTAYQPADGQAADFHDFSPDIRAEEHMNGLKAQLNVLSFKCGLGAGRYEFDKAAGVKTATEVISEQSDLYQSMKKHELVLEHALTGLVDAIFSLLKLGEPEVTITFDDSIIQDKTTMRNDAREDVGAGLMSKFRYLTEVVGMSEQDASKELERIRAEASITADAIDFFNVKTAE